MTRSAPLFFSAALLFAATPVVELKHYPLDSLEGVITRSNVRFERSVSSDGGGALVVDARKPTTIHLFETGDIDVEDARLSYRARMRTRKLKGTAFLEMWCHFPGRGEYFSRGLQYSLTGTNDWISVEAPFFLNAGENPDRVKLNLVINGHGRVWIDDIRLVKSPLE